MQHYGHGRSMSSPSEQSFDWDRFRWLLGPIVAGVAGGVVAAYTSDLFAAGRWMVLIGSALTISGVGIGFLGAFMGILASIDHRPVIDYLKEHGGYRVLIHNGSHAIWFCAALMVLSAVGLLLDLATLDCAWRKTYLAFWGALVGGSIFCSARIIRQLTLILARHD